MFTPSVRREQETTLHTDFISTDKFGREGGAIEKEETGLVRAQTKSAAAEIIQLQAVSVITLLLYCGS